MVNVSGIPVQPTAEGVTVIAAVTGVLPVFIAVNDAILPLPLAARPIDVFVLVQLKVVPLTEPVNVIAFVAAALHNI